VSGRLESSKLFKEKRNLNNYILIVKMANLQGIDLISTLWKCFNIRPPCAEVEKNVAFGNTRGEIFPISKRQKKFAK